MNDIEKWLAEGSLNSDGLANEVVDLVMTHPLALDDVLACLESTSPVVRGHAADALEKIGREKPNDFLPYTQFLQKIALTDSVCPILGHHQPGEHRLHLSTAPRRNPECDSPIGPNRKHCAKKTSGNALEILTDNVNFPKGWVKSRHIKAKLSE